MFDGRVGRSEANGVSATVELTPQQHDLLARLAGNELKDPSTGLGLKDTLNGLVEGTYPRVSGQNEWDRSPPAVQALMVQSLVNKFRAAAKQQLLQEFPDLKDAIETQWQARIQALQGQTSTQGQGAR